MAAGGVEEKVVLFAATQVASLLVGSCFPAPGCWSFFIRPSIATPQILVNDSKFPSAGIGGNGGLLNLSHFVAAHGLDFGLYTSAGAKMCSGDAGGSAGNEARDAELFVSWNVSLIKIDDCGSSREDAQAVMQRWRSLCDSLSPHRHVRLHNSQVGCCVGASGACSDAFKQTFPDWCYETATTYYQVISDVYLCVLILYPCAWTNVGT